MGSPSTLPMPKHLDKTTPKYLLQVVEKWESCIQEVLAGDLVEQLILKGLQGAGMTWMVPNHDI